MRQSGFTKTIGSKIATGLNILLTLKKKHIMILRRYIQVHWPMLSFRQVYKYLQNQTRIVLWTSDIDCRIWHYRTYIHNVSHPLWFQNATYTVEISVSMKYTGTKYLVLRGYSRRKLLEIHRKHI